MLRSTIRLVWHSLNVLCSSMSASWNGSWNVFDLIICSWSSFMTGLCPSVEAVLHSSARFPIVVRNLFVFLQMILKLIFSRSCALFHTDHWQSFTGHRMFKRVSGSISSTRFCIDLSCWDILHVVLKSSCIALSFKLNCRCSSSLLHPPSVYDYVMSLSLLPTWKICVSYIRTTDVAVHQLLLGLSYCPMDGRLPRLNQACSDLNRRRFRLWHLQILLLSVNICDGAVTSTTSSCGPDLLTVCREIWHKLRYSNLSSWFRSDSHRDIRHVIFSTSRCIVFSCIPSSLHSLSYIDLFRVMNCLELPDFLVSCMLICCTWRISQLQTTNISWHFLSLSTRESPCVSSRPVIYSYWCRSSIAPVACISRKSLVNLRRDLTKLILSYTIAQEPLSVMTSFSVTTRTSELTSASHALLVPIINGYFSITRVPRWEGRPSANHNAPIMSCSQERSELVFRRKKNSQYSMNVRMTFWQDSNTQHDTEHVFLIAQMQDCFFKCFCVLQMLADMTLVCFFFGSVTNNLFHKHTSLHDSWTLWRRVVLWLRPPCGPAPSVS